MTTIPTTFAALPPAVRVRCALKVLDTRNVEQRAALSWVASDDPLMADRNVLIEACSSWCEAASDEDANLFHDLRMSLWAIESIATWLRPEVRAWVKNKALIEQCLDAFADAAPYYRHRDEAARRWHVLMETRQYGAALNEALNMADLAREHGR